jgi:hypothetical protein
MVTQDGFDRTGSAAGDPGRIERPKPEPASAPRPSRPSGAGEACYFIKQLAGWMNGWLAGWLDGWMDGWMDDCLLG